MMQYLSKTSVLVLLICVHLCSSVANTLRADVAPSDAQKLYDRVTPSLVGVKFTWESELSRR